MSYRAEDLPLYKQLNIDFVMFGTAAWTVHCDNNEYTVRRIPPMYLLKDF